MNVSSAEVLLREAEKTDSRFTDNSMAVYQIRVRPQEERSMYNDYATKVRTYLNSLHSSYPIYVVHSGRWLVGAPNGGPLPDSKRIWHAGTVISRWRGGIRATASTDASEDDEKAMVDADEKE
ncbi:hypothetical protein CB0940_04568 [Cercospora beticola]|uniref:Uncharacterized protein n=1 Tax=Cercospora beticola TaxID=122368 RepID=A0A2G5HJC3_CERBT|nr:hypothetical protein CB0940_04568 [Cercospora beticola]PIA92638.1 hypothetical protein CB0940_04568 [Cercospora beticola]WPB01820.1 hypothetical protein RHO25_006452 [Cercospora beticola]CAK1363348.1 unnamed protein product [Cercospora beticola]